LSWSGCDARRLSTGRSIRAWSELCGPRRAHAIPSDELARWGLTRFAVAAKRPVSGRLRAPCAMGLASFFHRPGRAPRAGLGRAIDMASVAETRLIVYSLPRRA
jgi:hypothetical protein